MIPYGYKNIQSVRGMHDFLPYDVMILQNIENVLKTVLNSYGYSEIRLPIVEFSKLFKRSIGEITDVVEKEMYTFKDQHGNELALRPEGTSGCVRAGIEHSLFYHQEQRWWYLGSMFRRERPQKGRYREFNQFSAEVFGQVGPDIDLELILIAKRCWKELGVSQYVSLELNSIGLLSSRIMYRKKLIHFLEKNKHNLDNSSMRRLYSNPMRILDTKNEKTKELLINAPVLSDFLDDSSKSHFIELCKLLDLFGVSYTINPYLVRGLDYYNRTVFEWVTDNLGVKKAICGGGRYDNLVTQLGGNSVPAIGFSIGLERLLLLIKTIYSNKDSIISRNMYIDVYLINLGNNSKEYAMLLSEHIRSHIPSLKLKLNHGGGSLKQQFERAIKNNAQIVLIVKNQNVFEKTVLFKNLKSGQQEILQYDKIVKRLYDTS